MKRRALFYFLPYKFSRLLLPLLASWPVASRAANGDWANAAGGSWAAYANWTPAGPPVPGTSSGDTVNFVANPTANATVTLDGNRTVGTLNLNVSTATASLGIAGNGTGGYLIFDNGASTAALNLTNAAGTAAHTIYAPVVLNSNLEISTNNIPAAAHAILGTITGNGSVSVDSDGAHPAASSNHIGQVAFGGYNTYTGGTTVTEARLESRSNWAFGTGAVTVNNGGGVGLFGGGFYRNDFNITGLGWNEVAGQLGAIRTDGNAVFNGTINAVATGAAPVTRINSHTTGTTQQSFFNGKITGSAGLEFTTSSTGSATWVLNNSTNDWSGTTRIGRATAAVGGSVLAVGANNTRGALGTGDVLVDAGGLLAFNRTDNITVPNNILAGAGNISQTGLGTTTLTSGSILHSGTTAASGLFSRLVFNPGGAGGALTLAATPGALVGSNYADIEFNTSSNVALTNAVTGARGAYVVQNGTGTLSFGGAGDNVNARAIVNSGTFVMNKASSAGVHAIGSRAPQYALIQNGGTVQLGGSGGDQIYLESAIRINGGTFDLNGQSENAGTFTGSGGVITNTNAVPGTLDMGGFANALGIFHDNNTLGGNTVMHAPAFNGVIQDGAGTVALTKSQAGLQILGGVNTYSGATTVTGGLLAITGSTLAAGTVNVTGGGLAGTGSTGNIVLSAIAGSSVRPGATGQDRDAVGVLNASSLTVNGGDLRLNYAAGGNDSLNLSGAANFAAASTVTPVFSTLPTVGVSTIVTGGAPAVVGVAPTVTLPADSRITLGTVAAAGNNVTLTLAGANAESVSWAAPGTAGVWDANGALNWLSSDGKYWNLDGVVFGGGAANTAVTLNTTVTPSSILDSSTSGGYNITGTGGIAGGGTFSKTGSSTSLLGTANPNFTGDVRVTGGTLVMGNAGALGDTTGQTFVSNGATLDVNGFALSPLGAANSTAEIFNISGSGVGGQGALLNSGAGQQNAFRFIRLTGDATVGVTQAASRMDIRGSGAVTANEVLDLGGFTLSKTGAGMFVITEGVQVTDGNLTVDQGTLSIETSAYVQGQGTITVNPAGILAYWTVANGGVTRPNVWNGGRITNLATNSAVSSPVTLTGNTILQGTGGTMSFGGNLAESGGNYGLTKNEASAYAFSGNVTYSGPTAANAGTLTLGALNTTLASSENTVNVTGNASVGTATPTVQGGTGGNLNFGGGGYTTYAGLPASITLNNGSVGFNTRVSNTVSSNIVTAFAGGTNTINSIGAEQDTVLTYTGAIGGDTVFGRMIINGGNANFGSGSSINLRQISLGNQSNNSAGANIGTLNITGGTHKVAALYTGDVDAANNAGIVNMSGGTLTVEPVGQTSLTATNNAGTIVGGVAGIRLGHWTNGNVAAGSILNLSGGVIDASTTTVSVGWDGSGFLNVTGGVLKARTLVVDGGGAEALPFIQRVDLSGGGRIELGFGGMPTDGTNTAINSGTGTWAAAESGDWTRGMSLMGNTTFEVDNFKRVNMTGVLSGNGNLTKTGNGILQLNGANVTTGSISASGTVRMGNPAALADGTFNIVGGTLDINGQQGSTPAATAVRPSSISVGGAGAAGMMGGIINASGTTGGISVDAAGSINIVGDTTAYTVGRLEVGSNITGATFNNLISGGTSTLTKTGQGQMIWRGTSASTIGNLVINGGHFYAEENDNNLGGTGNVTVNRGGMLSAWQSDGSTSQSKPVVLNGGALMADVTSDWTGGLTLTANSQVTRNSTNAAVINLTGATLNLNGYTLTRRDRGAVGAGASVLNFANNTSSGDGSLDIHAGNVNIGANSTFDGAGNIIVRTDATVTVDNSATVSKTIQLYGGSVSDNTTGTRSLAVNSGGSGYLRAANAGATVDIGTLNVLGSAATVANTRGAGMMFGSGSGYSAFGTATAPIGSITLTNNSVIGNNPNFTVSSNPGLTTANDTTFATWDGSKVTGLAPTQATIAASGAADFPMVVAAESVLADTTISNLVTDATVTVTGATLKIANGGIILREAGTAGWTGTGSVTSGRADGILGLTLANRFAGSNGLGGADVGSFTVGNITNNVVNTGTGAFRPVTLVVNGFGNSAGSGQQAYTGGTIFNGSRFEPTTPNALGQGPVTIREGGSVLFNGSYGVSNNMSLKGLGINEGGGTFGALRLGGGSGSPFVSGVLSLDSPVTRFHGTNTGTIVGDVVGTNTFQRTGNGTIIVRSALSYTGATELGTDGAGAPMGTHTVWSLANGGVPSGIGASGSAASNLIFQSGTLNYIGGGASTDRLFTVAPSMTNSGPSVVIANNGYGPLNFTNTGAVVMGNGSTDATLTLTGNNFTANTFTPQLSNPTGGRLNLTVNGTGSWTINSSTVNIGGTVNVGNGARLIMNVPSDVTLPVMTAGGVRSYLVKEGANTLTLGGTGLGAELDNSSGQLMVNGGTVVFDKRGSTGYGAGAIAGPGNAGGVQASRALGGSGFNNGDGLVINNGGTVRYAPTANADQVFDNVDVRVASGGTMDFNGKSDVFDSLNGAGVLTNGAAGTRSVVGFGANGSVPSALNFRALASFSGTIQDGAGQIEVIKLGNGVQELSGVNTYTGRTSLNAGLVRISSEDNLGAAPASTDLAHLILAGGGLENTTDVTIDDPTRGVWFEKPSPLRPAEGATLTLASTVRGGGNIDMVGAGTLRLSGANILTGATSIYRGTLMLDYTSQNNSKLADGNTLVLRGGTVALNGGSHLEVVSATTVDGATGGSANSGSTNIVRTGGGTSSIRLNAITRNMGGTLNVGGAGIADTDTTNSNGILGSANGAWATVGGNTWAVNSTNGADGGITGLASYAVNNYGAAANHVDVTADAAFAAATTVSTLRFNGAATALGLDGQTLTLNQQGILVGTGAGVSSIGNGTISSAALTTAATTDVIVHQHSSNPFTIDAVIAPGTSNTTGLTKAGPGKLVLTAANTYTGATHLNEGTLELAGNGTIGSGAGSIWVDGTLSLNRAGAYTIANGMGGTGTILKRDNSGVATLTGGIGTYSGGAVVSQGTLVVTGDAFSNANAINDLAANATVYGTIILGDANTAPTDTTAFYSGKGAAGSIRKDIIVNNTGTGSAILGGGLPAGTVAFVQTYEGTMQLNKPTTLRGNTAGITANAAGTVFRGSISGNVGTLTIDAPAIAALANNPIGTVANNNGSVGIQATNTFVGDVVVNGAMLLVGTGNAADIQDQIPDASNVTINGISSTVRAGLYLNGDSETINNLNGNANSFINGINGASAAQLILKVNGTGNFAGRITGGGFTLEKAGTGTLTLSGTEDNDSGRAYITGGTLLAAKTSAAAVHAFGGEIHVFSGGTLQLGGTGNDQLWDGSTILMRGGNVDMNGTSEALASLFGDSGTITNSAPATVSDFQVGGGTTAAGSGTLYGGVIQDGAGQISFTKNSNGAAVLTGNNTYTGPTTITGGYIQVGNGGTTGSISSTSGVITSPNTQLVFNRSNNVAFAPVISGTGGLVQNGTGVLEIPAGTVNTFTGPTVINDGEYKVNGSSTASAITLNPGTVLSGSGTVGAVGSNGGTIAPGNSPGIITTGSVVTDDASAFVFEINGTTAGTNHDQIVTNGSIDLDGTLVITLGYSVSYGDKVFLWINDGADAVSGLWNGLPEGSLIPAGGDKSWILSYNDDSVLNPTGMSSGLGNDISLYAVPEAGTSALVLLAGTGLLARRRRRQA